MNKDFVLGYQVILKRGVDTKKIQEIKKTIEKMEGIAAVEEVSVPVVISRSWES